MPIRFRKSIKLAPGIRMNFSSKGSSWTIGPRGASLGIGQRGTYLNTGIAGFSSRQKLAGSRGNHNHGTNTKVSIAITVEVNDSGEILFKDESGNPLTEDVITAAKKQNGDVIRELIQKKCDQINGQVEALSEIHLYTPESTRIPSYQPLQYGESQPVNPLPIKPNFFNRWFKKSIARIEAQNTKSQLKYEDDLSKWNSDRLEFDTAQRSKQDLIAKVIQGNTLSMEIFLEEVLQDIVWPRETTLSFDILEDGKKVVVDVDLPEIEDMPDKVASVPQRGYRLSVKEISATQVQKNYMRHVHAVGFRIIGEIFAALPTVNLVLLSGYSQRASIRTGEIEDEYLYSVKVRREEWGRIQFANLTHIEVVESLSQFELKRSMSKTGVFKAIKPIEE